MKRILDVGVTCLDELIWNDPLMKLGQNKFLINKFMMGDSLWVIPCQIIQSSVNWSGSWLRFCSYCVSKYLRTHKDQI